MIIEVNKPEKSNQILISFLIKKLTLVTFYDTLIHLDKLL